MHLTPTHILTITEMGDLAINCWPAFSPCPPNALPAFVEPKCDYYLSIYRGDISAAHVVLPYDQGGVIGYAAYALKDTGDQAEANEPLSYGTLTPEKGTGVGLRVKATASANFSLCPASGRLCRIEPGGKQITVFDYLKAAPFVLPPGTKLDVPTLRRLINQST
ncbi:hypothetical protein EV122DRAFT_284512 [Schizophyllum commune]